MLRQSGKPDLNLWMMMTRSYGNGDLNFHQSTNGFRHRPLSCTMKWASAAFKCLFFGQIPWLNQNSDDSLLKIDLYLDSFSPLSTLMTVGLLTALNAIEILFAVRRLLKRQRNRARLNNNPANKLSHESSGRRLESAWIADHLSWFN